MIKLNSDCQEDTASSVIRGKEAKSQPKRLTAPRTDILVFSFLYPQKSWEQCRHPQSMLEEVKPRLSTTSEMNVPGVASKYCPCVEIALRNCSNHFIRSSYLNTLLKLYP